MESNPQFQTIFTQLKSILKAYEQNLKLVVNSDDNYSLDTTKIHPKLKKEIFFGAVQIKKNYVSYHLMPVYVYPQLLEEISPELQKRMQGKSCFNFKKSDESLFIELEELTKKGYISFKENGLI